MSFFRLNNSSWIKEEGIFESWIKTESPNLSSKVRGFFCDKQIRKEILSP